MMVLSTFKTLKLIKSLSIQDESFGFFVKLMVFRANGEETRISHEHFVILPSLHLGFCSYSW